MKETNLIRKLNRLNRGAQEAVQNGTVLSELDLYLHVKRPIEDIIKKNLNDINALDGGLLMLVGSAGDGKSHIISRLRHEPSFNDFVFLNDATEGCSPEMSAIDTLKYNLSSYSDNLLSKDCNEKTVIAINQGKLLDLIEDDSFDEQFHQLKNLVEKNFNDGDVGDGKIRIISLALQQAFELNLSTGADYPVESSFMLQIMEKITAKSDNNPFYSAYKKDLENADSHSVDPVLINYELLQCENIQNSIVKLIIEAIIRFDLTITPRDFLDFIHSILVFPKWRNFREQEDIFQALLPTLIFNSSDNKVQKALSMLDPLNASNVEHEKRLSCLNAASSYKDTSMNLDCVEPSLRKDLEKLLIKCFNQKQSIETSCMIFRIEHLLNYHSESYPYIDFLNKLVGYYKRDNFTYEDLEILVREAIPRHYGSYFSKSDCIPLNIQGRKYKIFASLDFEEPEFYPKFDSNKPHLFDRKIKMIWTFKEENVPLNIDYHLFEHLYELKCGKLATTYEGEKNLTFSNFIRKISQYSSADTKVFIMDNDNEKTVFSMKKSGLLRME